MYLYSIITEITMGEFKLNFAKRKNCISFEIPSTIIRISNEYMYTRRII